MALRWNGAPTTVDCYLSSRSYLHRIRAYSTLQLTWVQCLWCMMHLQHSIAQHIILQHLEDHTTELPSLDLRPRCSHTVRHQPPWWWRPCSWSRHEYDDCPYQKYRCCHMHLLQHLEETSTKLLRANQNEQRHSQSVIWIMILITADRAVRKSWLRLLCEG